MFRKVKSMKILVIKSNQLNLPEEIARKLKGKEVELVAEQYKKINLPDIPIEVNVETGDNWEEMEIYK